MFRSFDPDDALTAAQTRYVFFGYDLMGRQLFARFNSGATTSRFAYDGLDAIAEYNGSGTLQRRFVFDPATGAPLVWYEGTGIAATDRRYLSADERGSIVSVSDSNGAALAVNSYDQYGNPDFGALAGQRFGYTGQMWLAGPQLWHYRFRAYHPRMGRFLQTDPIGYGSGPNVYAYVLNDPVNFIDPLGLVNCPGEILIRGPGAPTYIDEWGNIVVTGSFICVPLTELYTPNVGRGGGDPGGGGGGGGDADIQRNVSPCMQKFLASQGYGAPNLPKITFNRGDQGNLLAKAALALGYPAITVGSNVYVAPSAWDAGRFGPGTSGFFEETIHSIQWSQSGAIDFLGAYLSGGGAALLLTGNAHDNPVELEAVAISKQLEREYANSGIRCP